MRLEVIGRQAHIAPAVFQDEKYLSVNRRGDVKIIHRFIPDRHFGAGHVSALGPSVRFAFDKHRGTLAAEIKAVHFLNRAYPPGRCDRPPPASPWPPRSSR